VAATLTLVPASPASPGLPQGDSETERQREALRVIESRLTVQEQEARELWAALGEQQPPCTAELRTVDGTSARTVAGVDAVVLLNLIGTVSQPVSRCLPASIWVTASYLGDDGELICTGTVRDAALQSTLSGPVSLEIQPWSLIHFVRWANQPPRTDRGALRIACLSPDGLLEVATLPSRTAAVSLRISLFPPGGGLATSEYRLALR
jgi:hypothetical protein